MGRGHFSGSGEDDHHFFLYGLIYVGKTKSMSSHTYMWVYMYVYRPPILCL